MSNSINVRITDETEGKRLSQVSSEKTSMKSATRSMTTPQVSKKATKGMTSVGNTLANTATGGVYGKTTAMIGPAATPVGIALLALTVANASFQRWKDLEQQRREQERTALQAGGQYRQNENLSNLRVRAISGRLHSGDQTTFRRR